MTTTEEYVQSLVDAAVSYADIELPVFPLHSPRKEPRARCDCKDGNDCRDAAKHPRTMHGLKDATTDLDQVRRWWGMWPRANVAIAIPKPYMVLDIDGPDGLDAIAAEGWGIPNTVTASTARGWHYWFEAEVEIRPGSDYMPRVDMRGPGGYVVAPPSLHASGVIYDWQATFNDIRVAPAPDWIYTLVERARGKRRALAASGVAAGPIFEGGRNDTLTRIAGAMRRHGCSSRVILAALEADNSERCSPPLEQEDLIKIAESIARYTPEQAERAGGAFPVWENPSW